MKEEQELLRKVGTGHPFAVPEGYWDRLTQEVMERLPEKESPVTDEEEPSWRVRVKPWLYMAAMFAGAALLIRVAAPTVQRAAETQAAEEQEVAYIQQAVELAMMDDYALYEYLQEPESTNE